MVNLAPEPGQDALVEKLAAQLHTGGRAALPPRK